MSHDDPCWMSATALAAAVRERRISPVEVVKAVLARIEAVNPRLNAYVTLTPEAALAAARKAEQAVMRGDALGPLHGVPFSVKDTTPTRGVRTTMGSRLLRDNVPAENAVHVERLVAAGGIMVGKTNTPEFACKALTDNLLFGPTHNPWKLDRTPGGSSGGAAAAVAAGLAPLATGNDAGGSIRIPASCCGIFGLKPQYGRIPHYPFFDHWETLSHEGTLTRTVADGALMLDVMMGAHWGDRLSLPLPAEPYSRSLSPDVRGLAVAFSMDLGYARVAREVRTLVTEAAAALRDAGARIEEATPDLATAEPTYITLVNAELAAMLARFGPVESLEGEIHHLLLARVLAAREMSAREYLHATFRRREIAARVGQFFERHDLLVTPTLGTAPWRSDTPGGYVDTIDGERVAGLAWSFNHPFNLTGHPAASVPVGFTAEGLPVGLQIVGRAHREDLVLRAAAALEKARPWASARPSLAP